MVIRFLAEGAASGLNVIAVYVTEILRVTGFDGGYQDGSCLCVTEALSVCLGMALCPTFSSLHEQITADTSLSVAMKVYVRVKLCGLASPPGIFLPLLFFLSVSVYTCGFLSNKVVF